MSKAEDEKKHPDDRFRQRLVGALVLVTLAIIFLPMIFDKQADYQTTTHELVQALPRPQMSIAPDYQVEEVQVPEPLLLEEEMIVPQPKPEPAEVAAQAEAQQSPPPKHPPQQKQAEPGIDANNLPLSWSIQVASGGNLKAAQNLRDGYRKQGYKAYLRTEKNLHKVLLGPYIRIADANRACSEIKQRQKNEQACFVLRYRPAS